MKVLTNLQASNTKLILLYWVNIACNFSWCFFSNLLTSRAVQEDDQQTENYQLNIGDCRERPSLSISLFPSELNWINQDATSFN